MHRYVKLWQHNDHLILKKEILNTALEHAVKDLGNSRKKSHSAEVSLSQLKAENNGLEADRQTLLERFANCHQDLTIERNKRRDVQRRLELANADLRNVDASRGNGPINSKLNSGYYNTRIRELKADLKAQESDFINAQAATNMRLSDALGQCEMARYFLKSFRQRQSKKLQTLENQHEERLMAVQKLLKECEAKSQQAQAQFRFSADAGTKAEEREAELKSKVSSLEAKVSSLESDVALQRQESEDLHKDKKTLNIKIKSLERVVARIEQENKVLRREARTTRFCRRCERQLTSGTAIVGDGASVDGAPPTTANEAPATDPAPPVDSAAATTTTDATPSIQIVPTPIPAAAATIPAVPTFVPPIPTIAPAAVASEVPVLSGPASALTTIPPAMPTVPPATPPTPAALTIIPAASTSILPAPTADTAVPTTDFAVPTTDFAVPPTVNDTQQQWGPGTDNSAELSRLIDEYLAANPFLGTAQDPTPAPIAPNGNVDQPFDPGMVDFADTSRFFQEPFAYVPPPPPTTTQEPIQASMPSNLPAFTEEQPMGQSQVPPSFSWNPSFLQDPINTGDLFMNIPAPAIPNPEEPTRFDEAMLDPIFRSHGAPPAAPQPIPFNPSLGEPTTPFAPTSPNPTIAPVTDEEIVGETAIDTSMDMGILSPQQIAQDHAQVPANDDDQVIYFPDAPTPQGDFDMDEAQDPIDDGLFEEIEDALKPQGEIGMTEAQNDNGDDLYAPPSDAGDEEDVEFEDVPMTQTAAAPDTNAQASSGAPVTIPGLSVNAAPAPLLSPASPVESVASVVPDETNLSDQSLSEIAGEDSDGKEDNGDAHSVTGSTGAASDSAPLSGAPQADETPRLAPETTASGDSVPLFTSDAGVIYARGANGHPRLMAPSAANAPPSPADNFQAARQAQQDAVLRGNRLSSSPGQGLAPTSPLSPFSPFSPRTPGGITPSPRAGPRLSGLPHRDPSTRVSPLDLVRQTDDPIIRDAWLGAALAEQERRRLGQEANATPTATRPAPSQPPTMRSVPALTQGQIPGRLIRQMPGRSGRSLQEIHHLGVLSQGVSNTPQPTIQPRGPRPASNPLRPMRTPRSRHPLAIQQSTQNAGASSAEEQKKKDEEERQREEQRKKREAEDGKRKKEEERKRREDKDDNEGGKKKSMGSNTSHIADDLVRQLEPG